MTNTIVAYVNFYFPTYKTQFYPDNFIKACLVYQFLYAKYFTQKLDINQIIYKLSDASHSCRSNSPTLANHLIILVSLSVLSGNIIELVRDVYMSPTHHLKNVKYLAI